MYIKFLVEFINFGTSSQQSFSLGAQDLQNSSNIMWRFFRWLYNHLHLTCQAILRGIPPYTIGILTDKRLQRDCPLDPFGLFGSKDLWKPSPKTCKTTTWQYNNYSWLYLYIEYPGCLPQQSSSFFLSHSSPRPFNILLLPAEWNNNCIFGCFQK